MDCGRAEEILLAAADGLASPDEVAEAETHCKSCPRCARLQHGLRLLAEAPKPQAPEAVTEAVLAAVREERSALEERAAIAHPLEPAGLPGRWRWAGWERRFAGFAAAAAIVIVGLVAVGIALPRLVPAPQEAAVKQAPSNYGGAGSDTLAAPQAPETTSEAYDDRTAAAAPPYIVLDGMVYRLVEDRSRPSAATTAGVVTSALDEATSEPATMTAYADPFDSHLVWVQAPDGRTLTFRLVTRTYAGDEFALESGSDVLRFGEWPTLPQRFAPPASPDGSPTFRYFGFDDRGVRIYVPSGARPLDGFAVAPGTSPDDPAAGNPNWTWWSRID